MARQSRTATKQYAVQFEQEGRRWCESVKAPALFDAEHWARGEARTRGLRLVVTLPLNPEEQA